MIEKAYPIMSSKTGKPYIDEENCCYVFTEEEEANEFAGDLPVFVDGPKFYEMIELKSQCYAAGASTLCIITNGRKQTYHLEEKQVSPDYYNNTLNRILSQIKHRKKRKYLELLSNERYIVPAKIVTENDSVKILYAVAKNHNGDMMYLAFSDLNEYMLWSSDREGWKPLEIGYDTLYRIGYHNGFLINVCGNRIIFKRKWFEYIDQHPKKEDSNDNTENKKRYWVFI